MISALDSLLSPEVTSRPSRYTMLSKSPSWSCPFLRKSSPILLQNLPAGLPENQVYCPDGPRQYYYLITYLGILEGLSNLHRWGSLYGHSVISWVCLSRAFLRSLGILAFHVSRFFFSIIFLGLLWYGATVTARFLIHFSTYCPSESTDFSHNGTKHLPTV